jgi:hypothetical protein
MRRIALALALAAAAAPAPSAADVLLKESPRWGSFQLSISAYRPDVDSEFGGAASPYAEVFGSSRPLLFQVLFGRSLWVTEVGTLDVGMGVGYWQAYGRGISATTGTRGDTTSLLVVPITVAVTYRFDVLYDKWRIPFEPYVRGALLDYLWWASLGGQVSAVTLPDGREVRGQGGTFGWSGTVGVALVLDFFDPTLARQMDQDTGINRTLLFFDVTWAGVDDFGSSRSWQLGPGYGMWSAGLQFVF